MGKSAILKKIHNAAKNYQRYLAGKTFMYVYEGKSIEVVFKNSSFLHLTGVNTKLRAKEFYKHAKTKNGLKVQEFFQPNISDNSSPHYVSLSQIHKYFTFFVRMSSAFYYYIMPM